MKAVLMRQQIKQTRKPDAKAESSLLGDWQAFRALQIAVQISHGKEASAFTFYDH
jgi:hypothetical protein